MTIEQHKKEVQKLNELEVELITLVFDLQNDELIDKFSDWQDQRAVCNNGFVNFLKEAAEK